MRSVYGLTKGWWWYLLVIDGVVVVIEHDNDVSCREVKAQTAYLSCEQQHLELGVLVETCDERIALGLRHRSIENRVLNP
jgi:hypothetical protein